MRKSQASDSSKPTPKQKPRLAVITGFAQRAGAAIFQASFETVSGRASRKPLMLPPLEKCSPMARSTTMRTRELSSRLSNTSRSWSRCGIDTTLSGGRSRMTSARSRGSSISTRKPSSVARRGSSNFNSEAMLVTSVLSAHTACRPRESGDPVITDARIIASGWDTGCPAFAGHDRLSALRSGSFCAGRRRTLRLVIAGHEQAAQQLADRRLRNGLDKNIAARPLEIGEAGIAAMLVEMLVLDRGAALDEGRDDLAPALVGQADHRNLRYRGVQRQAAFDLHRRNILAAGDDHVVDPAGDEQIAVGVEHSGVAGEIPAVPQCLGIGLGPPPVALEGFVGLQQRDDLAFLAGRG